MANNPIRMYRVTTTAKKRVLGYKHDIDVNESCMHAPIYAVDGLALSNAGPSAKRARKKKMGTWSVLQPTYESLVTKFHAAPIGVG